MLTVCARRGFEVFEADGIPGSTAGVSDWLIKVEDGSTIG